VARANANIGDSHKVYYGIFYSKGISDSCIKTLSFFANTQALWASRRSFDTWPGARQSRVETLSNSRLVFPSKAGKKQTKPRFC
jgi:hypothetical protein